MNSGRGLGLKCENCEWWFCFKVDKKTGECYRYPPLFQGHFSTIANRRPITVRDDFCSKFKEKQ